LRADKSTCFPVTHKYHDVTHHGLDAVAVRFIQEAQLLMADANPTLTLNSTRLEYIWQVGNADLFDGMKTADEVSGSLDGGHPRRQVVGWTGRRWLSVWLGPLQVVGCALSPRPLPRHTQAPAQLHPPPWLPSNSTPGTLPCILPIAFLVVHHPPIAHAPTQRIANPPDGPCLVPALPCLSPALCRISAKLCLACSTS
jgi:hypothetical protein